MAWRNLAAKISSTLVASVWWLTVAPYCYSTDLPTLGASVKRPLTLGGTWERIPLTELIGRLQWFRGRVRQARALLIGFRALLICGVVLLLNRAYQLIFDRSLTLWLPFVLFVILAWAVYLSLNHVISPFVVARLVDRRMRLNAQVATAVELTLSDRLDRPLARSQVRVATNKLRELEPNDVVPFVVPWRDLRLFLGVIALYGVVSYAGFLGINLPRPVGSLEAELAKQSSLEAQAPASYTTIDPSRAQLSNANALNPTTGTSQVQDDLNALKQQHDAHKLTDAEYQQNLQDLQQQVAQKASESMQAQQSLNSLAASLKDVAATDAAGSSLNQGNYQQASQQLSDLGKQASQLSPDSRNKIADQLSAAATQSQSSNPTMARAAADAASALRQGDSASAAQAFQQLAQSVQDTSGQIADQSQLGQDLQQAQQDATSAQSGSPNGSSTPVSAASGGQGQPGSPGQTSTSSRETQGTGGPGSPGSDNPLAGVGETSIRATGSQNPQDAGTGGGGAGSAPGGAPLGTADPLAGQGVRLTILGKSSTVAVAPTSGGDRSVPLTSAGGSNLNSLAASGAVPSNVPIEVHQESVVVPLERQSEVREYFSNGN